ncbi:ADP-ribosylglycohydrolase family protein [Castellaniella caeni]|uniref:ADP-ribosylglycohydrolase family protein n=1 Tax=Castellaniella caeni TaxID=266123 RepID=UPI000835ACCD|nr:ADP-ribosylglycohydrolase family protein [Castellaniella caeni]
MADTDITFEQRAQGAIMGAYIGDALALGPHWYYDLDALHRAYGNWITDYTDPQPDRYHAGLKAGQSSQAGYILDLLVRSLAEKGQYDEADFCQRLDDELFARIDGTPMNGPGGYTSQSIREAWRLRVREHQPWGRVSGLADTTEAAERIMALAVRYAWQPTALAQLASTNTALTQHDTTVMAMTVAYACVLGSLVRGEPLDAQTSERLMQRVHDGSLPFHAVTRAGEQTPPVGPETPRHAGQFPSPDALLTASCIVRAATDPDIRIEPAWKASLVYGMPCAVYHQFPAAYYLAGRFQGNFEQAVLNAVNGGGQNQARAILTGALAGAIGGIQAIPDRFIEGLEHHEQRLAWAAQIAKQAQQVPQKEI